MSAIARVYDFYTERAKRRPYAGIGDDSLAAMAQRAFNRGDLRAMDEIIQEVKRRRAARELAK